MARLAVAVVGILLLINGCGEAASAPPPPAPGVTVNRPVSKEVVQWDEYTGHLESPEMVNVQARVSGLILNADFLEGMIVEQGRLLFQIDPRPFQADYDAKVAALAKDEAQLSLARTNFSRSQEAIKNNAISKQDFDTSAAMQQQALAVVDQDKAAAAASKLNLDWTQVTAPIKGRIGRKLITPGNLIVGGAAGAGQATLLTTIQSVDPMYCSVDVDERSVLKYQQLIRERKIRSARVARIPCFLALANETNFPHEGFIDFVDNHVDPATGTLRVRAVFPNTLGWLTPGFFARMRIPGSGRYQALLIPDVAIQTDQNQKYVLVAGSDNAVQYRPVQLGPVFGNLQSIEGGVTADDRVIVNGIQRARPGTKVTPAEEAVSLETFPLTAPGSPTTRDLPEIHSLPATAPTGPGPSNLDVSAIQPPDAPPPATTPSESAPPTTGPSTVPAGGTPP